MLLIQRYTPVRLVLAIWVARPLQFAPALLGISGELGRTDEAVVANAYDAFCVSLAVEVVFCAASAMLEMFSAISLAPFAAWLTF